jgi:hypothetical protein
MCVVAAAISPRPYGCQPGFLPRPYLVTVWLSRSPSLTTSSLAAGWPLLISGIPVQDATAPLLPCVVTSITGTSIGARLPPGMGAGRFVVVVSLRSLPSQDLAHECSTVTDEVFVHATCARSVAAHVSVGLCAVCAPSTILGEPRGRCQHKRQLHRLVLRTSALGRAVAFVSVVHLHLPVLIRPARGACGNHHRSRGCSACRRWCAYHHRGDILLPCARGAGPPHMSHSGCSVCLCAHVFTAL